MMMMRTLGKVICIVTLLAGVSGAYATEKPVLAVMELEDRSGRFSEEMLGGATDYLRAALVATHRFLVVDRGRQEEKRKALLNQLKRESHDPCYDDQCKVELGRNLAADTLLTCRITALGKTCAFSCELVPLDRAVTEAGGLDRFDCSEDGLAGSLDAVVAQLKGQTGPGDGPDHAPLFVEAVPSDDAPVPVEPAAARSPREEYLRSGFEPNLVGDYLASDMSLDGWRRYRKGHISRWNMAWCSFLPGACLYYVALNGGNTFHFVRGLLYTGGYVAGITTFTAADSSGGQTSGMTLQNLATLAHIVDGGFSIYYRNRSLKAEMQQKYPRQWVPPPPGARPIGPGR